MREIQFSLLMNVRLLFVSPNIDLPTGIDPGIARIIQVAVDRRTLPQYPTLQVNAVLPELIAGDPDCRSRFGGVVVMLLNSGFSFGELLSSPVFV